MNRAASRRTVGAMTNETTAMIEAAPTHLPLRPWLAAEEVAPLLCTTAHTLRRLAREDRSPVLVRRIGGRWRFSRSDVLRFLDGADVLPSEAS